MIPKIIHYCWFGGEKFPPIVNKCIESWKHIMPEYEIMRWDESNVPINNYAFMKEAYNVGKWAFVSDYARYWVLEQYGGFFMDCDVEVLRKFDDLREEELFFAIQDHIKKNVCFVSPGLIIGAQKGHLYIKKIRERYDTLHFMDVKGNCHYEYSSPRVLTQLLLEDTNLEIKNVSQKLSNGIKIFSSEYFDPKDPRAVFTKGIHITNQTYAIHHGAASWIPKSRKYKRILSILFRNLIGDKVMDKLRGKEKGL